MRIPEMYSLPKPTISFEFFPPKTAEAERVLLEDTVPALKRVGAAFISVTYGAGGGTRDQTLRIVDTIRSRQGVEAMAHVTCVGATRDALANFLDQARSLGIDNILALRGDPPRGEVSFTPVAGGFSYAVDLIAFVKEWNHFSIGAAGYPEGHIECQEKHLDWDRTAAKIEAGAEYILTQLFYGVEDFLKFRDYLQNRRGIRAPIVPGIMPFLNAEQINRITRMCGASIPDPIRKRIETYAGDDESVRKLGVEVCADLIARLLSHGAPGVHLYCLNRAASCAEILQNLGLA